MDSASIDALLTPIGLGMIAIGVGGVSFLAIRIAKHFIHPVVFTSNVSKNLPGSMLVTYCVAQVALLVLAYTLYRVELSGKRIDARLRELRLA